MPKANRLVREIPLPPKRGSLLSSPTENILKNKNDKRAGYSDD